jgi:hypothetical protein
MRAAISPEAPRVAGVLPWCRDLARSDMEMSWRLPMPPEELLEAGMLVYLRGLGLPEGAAAMP